MTDTQLYLAIGVPILFNGLLISIVLWSVNGRIASLQEQMNTRFEGLTNSVNTRFDGVNQRFDDMRDMWRAELTRVEQVLDARLKHLEQR